MNEDVEKYYRDRVKNSDRGNFLWQVGKTVKGQEVSREQINLIVETIASRLQLNKNDIVLDIGCGNGLLTIEISRRVEKIIGLELSQELYQIANEYNFADNASYVNDNILNLGATENKGNFTKIYLYEVIQHLDYREAEVLFSKLNEFAIKGANIFIGGILDAEKKWLFFDTEERRHAHFAGLLLGKNPMGTWHHKDFLIFLAGKYDFYVECIEQDPKLYTSHYRFDCLLQKHK